MINHTRIRFTKPFRDIEVGQRMAVVDIVANGNKVTYAILMHQGYRVPRDHFEWDNSVP